ncbi:MAG TPA: hypothetical protein VFV66_00010 [Nonomuraea sp.]|nr:hypothetical protein [Nonomuraea sp.]
MSQLPDVYAYDLGDHGEPESGLPVFRTGDVPRGHGVVREADPVFTPLFPWLIWGEGRQRVLRPRRAAPRQELVAQAAATALVRGEEAGQALRRQDGGVRQDEAAGVRKRDLPDTVDPGDRGHPGDPGHLGDPGDPVDPVERWAGLMVAMMRARVQADHDDPSYYELQAPRELAFAVVAEVLDEFAEHPMPVLLPALPVAAATGGVLSRAVLGVVRATMADWALAGVIERTDQPVRRKVLEPLMEALVAGFWPDDDPSADHGAAVRAFLGGIALGTVHGSPAVRVTPLGAYGLRRLLRAHGRVAAGPATLQM